MENKIKDEILNVEISLIRKFNILAHEINKKYRDVIFFTVGEPSFNTPENIKNAGIRAIENNHTRYTATAGIEQLREKIVTKLKKKNIDYHKDEIVITSGSTEAISDFLNMILSAGDEVIIPAPAYPLYEVLATFNKAIIKYVDTTNNNFQITAEKIEEAITAKTKLIIFSSPSNPTGEQVTVENKRKIVQLLKKHDIFLLVDEVYSSHVFNGTFSSFAEFNQGIRKKLLIVNGFSKSHSMTGWRIGYIYGDRSIIQHLNKIHLYNTSSPNTISQYAALEAVETDLKLVEMYLEKQNFVVSRLNQIGLTCQKPSGTFYILAKISSFNLTSEQFCKKLLETERVATVPGNAFSKYGEGYIRISYDVDSNILQEGLNRMENFCQKIKK